MDTNCFEQEINNEKFKVCRCKKCGEFPIRKTYYKMYEDITFLTCRNNCIYDITVKGKIETAVDTWNKINDESIEIAPVNIKKIHNSCCGTCIFKNRCTKLINNLYNYICDEYIPEKE